MTSTSVPRKKRIVILGGGPAGLSAAHELTRYPGWQDRYEVVVYQLGWRLGGKTATGRGPHGRIEEHGIHIMQGWYHNTFRMVRQIYAERQQRGLAPESPFQCWYDAFDKTGSTLLSEFRPDLGKWVTRAITLPRNRKTPGDSPDPTWTIIQDVVRRTLTAVTADSGVHSPLLELGELPRLWTQWRASRVPRVLLTQAARLVKQLGKLLEWLERSLTRLPSETLRWSFILLDLVCTNLRGILQDVFDPRTGTFDYEAINHLDYREWLARHGASELTRYSSVVRFVYAGAYAYLNDGGQQGGLLAAGSVLRALISALGYRDAFVWFFKAGTGDTLIMPIYQVLAERGVRFEFFRRVKSVHWSSTGEIEQVTVGRQVTLAKGTYRPAIAVEIELDGQRHVIDAWPNRPLQDQIVEDIAGAELESPWSSWQDVATETLRKGQDFDQLILAIPVAALKDICTELIARDARWRDMVTHVATTQTHSFQLWLKPSLEELGLRPRDWGLPDNAVGINTVTYSQLGKSWTDMSLVVPYEQWPEDQRPGCVLYFTGVLPEDDDDDEEDGAPGYDDAGYPERQRLRVKYLAEQWLHDNMGYFFPGATRREAPQGLDLGLLVDWQRKHGPPRLSSQYFRANIDPSERYTLAKPYRRQVRLRTDASGFGNLFLAGDWIDYGLNMGFLEGAVISGMQAAQAVMRSHYGFAAYQEILGEQEVARAPGTVPVVRAAQQR